MPYRDPSRLGGWLYAHVAWGTSLGLAEPSTVASPIYTLADKRADHEQTGA